MATNPLTSNGGAGKGSGRSYEQATTPGATPDSPAHTPSYTTPGGPLPFQPPNPQHGGTTIQPSSVPAKLGG